MSRGLIFGKFMPFHAGHQALIEFAAQRCDHLTVLVASLPTEPIPGELRYRWVRDEYQHREDIEIDWTNVDLPQRDEPCREVSRVWGKFLLERYPDVDTVFTSEGYGDYVAEAMGIRHVPFDIERGHWPVSGRQIRQRPVAHWEMIPERVRPYFVKKVCIYGSESTGKTTLTPKLAAHFNTNYVLELARDIIGDRQCVAGDIPKIARVQTAAVRRAALTSNKLLFCDSDLITTEIYSTYYFDHVPDVVYQLQPVIRYDLHLLMDIDVPWVDDVQRISDCTRPFFHDWFKRELLERGLPFVEINGDWDQRFDRAVAAVESIMDEPGPENPRCWRQFLAE